MPNLYGLVPSCFSSLRPFFSADRAYSNSSIAGFLSSAEVEVALVPDLEVGELVVRRQERMRLAVALDLRDFVEPLPLRARLDVLARDALAVNDSIIGNIRPLDRLPLCAIASTSPPVFSS